MSMQDFSTSIVVDQSANDVFQGVNNVRGWWSENIEGSTDRLDAEFLYGYKDVHVSKMKIVEWVPNRRVVWLVLENQFNFTGDRNEWKGNRIVFDISEANPENPPQTAGRTLSGPQT